MKQDIARRCSISTHRNQNPSGYSAEELGKHRSCWKHVASCLQRTKRKLTTRDMDKIRANSFCFFETYPHRRRSNLPDIVAESRCLNKKLDSNTFERLFDTLWRSISVEQKAKFTHLDSVWFSLYLTAAAKEKVLSWIKRRAIFSKKYVLVPIVCWGHWNLLILCHFDEDLDSADRKPCMILLDSLHMADPRRIEPSIRKFVFDIYKAEGFRWTKAMISRIPLLVPKVPQQKNTECGSFVLYFIHLFLQAAPENFSISDGYPYFMNQDWFTRGSFEQFCRNLDKQLLIQDDEANSDSLLFEKPWETDGYFAEELGKHRSCWKHVASCLQRTKRKLTKRDMDKIRANSFCFFETYPHRRRSHRRRSNLPDIVTESRCLNKKLDSNTFERLFDTLWRSISVEQEAKFTHLDSMWFSLYLTAAAKEKVLSWIKRRAIFSKKYVLVPIVCWGHWNLLILCHFDEDLGSTDRKPCMILLDSLHMADPRRIEPSIRKFVFDIYKAEGFRGTKAMISRIPLLVPKVPQQKNTECGSFVLYFIHLFLQAAPENFSISDGYPYFMNQDWFTRGSFEQFCRNLDKQLLIQDDEANSDSLLFEKSWETDGIVVLDH